jgi:GNAT superfamily N-acetyltransferase
MPHSSRYDSTVTMPPHLEIQIRSLLYAEWPDPEDDNLQPLTEPKLHPTYFILADENQVLSYARTIWAMVSHLGQGFKLYGLGDVVTAPEFRRQGYGSRIVEEATTHIKSDREADAALLLTDPVLEILYRRSGWEFVPGLQIMTGEYDSCSIEALFPMMLFLSAKANALRDAFTEETLVLPGDEW